MDLGPATAWAEAQDLCTHITRLLLLHAAWFGLYAWWSAAVARRAAAVRGLLSTPPNSISSTVV